MPSNFRYESNCGDYVFTDNGVPIKALTPELAIAFNYDPIDDLWFLYKHGAPEAVNAWLQKENGKRDLADAIHVLSGALPIDMVNKCLENSQHLGSLVKHCLSQVAYTDYEQKTWRLDGIAAPDTAQSLRMMLTMARKLDSFDGDVVDVVEKLHRNTP